MKLMNEITHARHGYYAKRAVMPNRLILNESSHMRLTNEYNALLMAGRFTYHGLAVFEDMSIVQIPGFGDEMYFELGIQVDAPETDRTGRIARAEFTEAYERSSRETPKTFAKVFTRDELSRLKQLDGVVFEDELLNRTYLGTPDTSEDKE